MRDKFDRIGFMAYLETEFSGYSGFDGGTARDLVGNLIDMAVDHFNCSKDQLVYFLADIIPEIEFGEIAMFTPDHMLSDAGKMLKQEALLKHGRKAA